MARVKRSLTVFRMGAEALSTVKLRLTRATLKLSLDKALATADQLVPLRRFPIAQAASVPSDNGLKLPQNSGRTSPSAAGLPIDRAQRTTYFNRASLAISGLPAMAVSFIIGKSLL